MYRSRTTRRRYLIVACLTISLDSGATISQSQTNWPAFRNGGSGIAQTKKIGTKWSPEKGVAWRSAIPGYGQSSPVVWNGKLFLTSSDGPLQERCMVHCFDLASGNREWTSEAKATTKVENYFRNSRAAPTCVVDENVVVSFFASGDVTAMGHDGKTIWSVSLFKRYGEANNERGTASSLAQTKKLVLAAIDHDGPSYLVAINKTSGAIAWKADRGKRVPSWSSPVVAQYENQELVILSSADSVEVYDAKTGKSLWKLEGIKGNHIPSASVVGNSIYVGSTQMWHGKNDPQKVAASNCRIEINLVGGKPTFEVTWGAQQANSYYSSPLCFAGYVYYVNKSGVLFCIDQDSGQRLFAKRIGNPCWASAIGVKTEDDDQFVFFPMKNGSTVVIRPGPEYEQVARNRLWGVDEMKRVADAAAAQRAKNKVPADQAKPKTGPEKMLSGLPEKSLHKMFSYGDPIVYAAIVVENKIIFRTGQHLYCVQPSFQTRPTSTPKQ